MEKRTENLFTEKFRLLNSQKHSENIHWSSSDSSDFENVSNCDKNCNLPNKVRTKRKRKKKIPKNLSNLEITIIDTSWSCKDSAMCNNITKTLRKTDEGSLQKSPNFAPTPTYFPPYKCIKSEQTSPILTCKVNTQQSRRYVPEKSPILLLKNSSPKLSPSIRKSLFRENQEINRCSVYNNAVNNIQCNLNKIECSHLWDSRKKDSEKATENSAENKNTSIKDIQSSGTGSILNDSRQNGLKKINPETINPETIVNKGIKLESSQDSESLKTGESLVIQKSLDDSFAMLKTSNVELAKRVQSYFDNHFSSENASQNSQISINDTPTPRSDSKSSEEIEILSITTQINPKRAHSQTQQDTLSRNPSVESSQSAEMGEKTKKVHYKKGGLSYRLNALLKKQTANISLWQHERFLAANSNFVIPKGEHHVFRIQKVCFKYGAFLLESVDIDNIKFLIIINSVFVQNVNITANMILKLYDPCKIVDFNEDCKLIIQVCKFECIDISKGYNLQ